MISTTIEQTDPADVESWAAHPAHDGPVQVILLEGAVDVDAPESDTDR